MKTRCLVVVLATALFASAAMAANIKISVQGPNGESQVTVDPGGTVNYRIVGELSNNPNLGLALIGLSLDFTGGNIDRPANEPTTDPMYNFDYDPAIASPHKEGLTNPIGFGGTLLADPNHGGRIVIVQAGGCQNTIKNTAGNADFPIGTVITNVAVFGSPEVIARGSFALPGTALAGNSYQLVAFDVFANVITTGQTGQEAYYATEIGGVVPVPVFPNPCTVDSSCNLTVVAGDVLLNSLASSSTAHNKSFWRTRFNRVNFTFLNAIASPPQAGDILIQKLENGGVFGPNLAGSFSFTVNGNVLTIQDTGTNLTHLGWYGIRNTGGWDGVEPFEKDFVLVIGDANNNGRVQFSDLTTINTGVPTDPALPDDRRDINADGRIQFSDMTAANSRILSEAPTKPTGHLP